MASRTAPLFEALAKRLGVAESDFLLLGREGIRTADDMYYKLPTTADLEDFLRTVLFPECAYIDEDSGQLTSCPRHQISQETYGVWKRGDDAAAIRKLWKAAKGAAEKELEHLVEGRPDAETKKINTMVAADMHAKAVGRGLPSELTDAELVGTISLSNVVDNHKVGGKHAYLRWEIFTSKDDEARAIRLGLGKKPENIRLLTTEGSRELQAIGVETDPKVNRVSVKDIVTLTDTLHIRAVAYEVAELVDFKTYQRFTDIYVRSQKVRVNDKMRRATINEVRLTDRLIHEEIAQYTVKGVGTMNEGIKFFCDNPDHQLLGFLKLQGWGYPGQGIEVGGSAAGSADGPPAASKCLKCGLTRDEHENRRFCQLEKPIKSGTKGGGGYKGKDKAGKGKGKTSKGSKGKDKEQGGSWGRWTSPEPRRNDPNSPYTKGYPDHAALREAPTPQYVHGQKFCVDYHVGESCSNKCGKSHRCPVFTRKGVCGESHRAVNH